MSTNDVPGHKPENNDKLAMGCWAESEQPNDKSLILVESVENGRVIFSVFDCNRTPIMEYRDAMPEGDFKTYFSWKPGEQKPGGKWRWHDRTLFPWNRIIREGSQDGFKYASAAEQLSAAEQVREHLRMRQSRQVNEEEVRDRAPRTEEGRTTAEAIFTRIGRALDQALFNTKE